MLEKTIITIKKNQRYVFAIAVVCLYFFINSRFPAEIITSQEYAEKNGDKISKEESTNVFLDQSQNGKQNYFSQLMERKTILGQTFITQAGFINSVLLDMDIIRQSNNGGKKYKLELRETNLNEKSPEIKSNILASVGFEIDDLEMYRQADGTLKFPLQAKVEKGNLYFLGINNENIETNRFNFLRLKGSISDKAYGNGSLVMKRSGKTQKLSGDLYFKIYSSNLTE